MVVARRWRCYGMAEVAVLRHGGGGKGNGLMDSLLQIVNPYEGLTIMDSQSICEFVCF